MKALLTVATLALLLAEIAWALAWWIPSADRRRLAAVAAKLPADAPAAEICAEVDLALHVRLTAEDVRVFRALCARGEAPAEALQTVLTYRRALGM